MLCILVVIDAYTVMLHESLLCNAFTVGYYAVLLETLLCTVHPVAMLGALFNSTPAPSHVNLAPRYSALPFVVMLHYCCYGWLLCVFIQLLLCHYAAGYSPNTCFH
ncbi:Uncharacterized protein TCM_002270 [Theobroma cacao]|uniref:Uncharacterized protein n=1 Tax=Theobroma cacao TaxID=3641 RepID=A0A061DL26_THECC|nr:Uncharacterized protein TCM_002270 [Theobroma cacao]